MNASIEELKQALLYGKAQDIAQFMQKALSTPEKKTIHSQIIELLEQYLFENNAYYLAKYLFLLYDKIEISYMARFYLQYCYEELLLQSSYIPIVNKYLSTAPNKMNANYAMHDKEYSYIFNGEEKKYCVHSFSNEIGYNLTLLKTPYGSIILDCGARCINQAHSTIKKEDLLAFLGVYKVSVSDIVGVIISHAHLDHYGSISTLLDVGISPARIYTDFRTKEIINDLSEERTLDSARPIQLFFVPGQKIQISTYDNGHILGSQLIVIHFDDKTVVYTGDFCLHNQKMIEGLNLAKLMEDIYIKNGVDCLITESTYGRKISNILPYDEAQKSLVSLTDKLISNGIKVFMLSSAVGRSQELVLALREKHRILIDGLSIKLTNTFERILNMEIADSNVKYSTCTDSKIDNFDFNDIIIVSSGMISQGSTSAQYIKELFDSRESVAIIRTGYMDNNEESYGYGILQSWKRHGGLLFDVSISNHASYEEIFALINALNPKNVVSIHGSGITNKTDPIIKSIDDKTIVINDIDNPVIINRWKNVVKTGIDAISEGRILDNSVAFQNAFKFFVKSIKDDKSNHHLLIRMNTFDTLSDLFDFLKINVEYYEKTSKPDNTLSAKRTALWTRGSTLYVLKGINKCQRGSHNIIPTQSSLLGQNQCNAELRVNYCLDCDRFFINHLSYDDYLKKHKVLIGNIVIENDGIPMAGDLFLTDSSPLRLCGYSVAEQDNLSQESRRYIIKKVIEMGVMSKSDVVRYLEYLITMNVKRKESEKDILKWNDDIVYTLSIDFEN